MMTSHNDADHYGGLSDLLDVSQSDAMRASGVTVEDFYHAGLSWWEENGKRVSWTLHSQVSDDILLDSPLRQPQ